MSGVSDLVLRPSCLFRAMACHLSLGVGFLPGGLVSLPLVGLLVKRETFFVAEVLKPLSDLSPVKSVDSVSCPLRECSLFTLGVGRDDWLDEGVLRDRILDGGAHGVGFGSSDVMALQ